MRITGAQIVVLGDGKDVDPDLGGVEPLPLLTVYTDQGVSGTAEMFRVPPGVARSALVGEDSFFGSQFIGMELTRPEAIWECLYQSMLHSNRRGWAIRCLGALDVALWDIFAKSRGLPVFALLGADSVLQTDSTQPDPTARITPYCTIVSDTWEPHVVLRQQVERCERMAAEGFRAFKVEPLYSSPETAVELVKRARRALGSAATLALDVGYGYNDHAVAHWVASRIEEYDVYFFETPFPIDVPEPYARLAASTSIPLAMGEHSATRYECLDMMDRGGVTVVQPYATSCGGLSEARHIVELARQRGALVIPGNWSTQILGMANAHLAACSPITPYVEYAAAELYESPLRTELQALATPVIDGTMALPTLPGVGLEVPADLIAHFRLDL